MAAATFVSSAALPPPPPASISLVPSVPVSISSFTVVLADDVKPSADILCGACNKPMIDPVTTPCHHLFCRSCFQLSWQNKPKKCPLQSCPRKLLASSAVSLEKSNPIAYRALFGSLVVMCPLYHNTGCTWSGTYPSRMDHINNNCLIHPVTCTHCSLLYPRGNIGLHESSCMKRPSSCHYCHTEMSRDALSVHHETLCDMIPMPCTITTSARKGDSEVKGCGKMIARKLLVEHQNRDCTKAVIACEYGSYGCDYYGARESMDKHDNTAAPYHTRLVTRSLTNQVQVLRSDLSTANNIINHLTNEMKQSQTMLVATQVELKSAKSELSAAKIEIKSNKSELASVGSWMRSSAAARQVEVKTAKNDIIALKVGLTKTEAVIKTGITLVKDDISQINDEIMQINNQLQAVHASISDDETAATALQVELKATNDTIFELSQFKANIMMMPDIMRHLKVRGYWTTTVGAFAFQVCNGSAFYVSPDSIIPLPSWPAPRNYAQATRIDDSIYITGGSGHGRRLDIFHLSSQTWSVGPSLLVDRCDHVMVQLVGTSNENRLMVIGGADKTCDIFDLCTQKWQAGPPTLFRHNASSGVSYGGRVYIFGSEREISTRDSASEVYEEDAKSGIGHWSPIMNVPNLGKYTTAVKIKDKIFVLGGRVEGYDNKTALNYIDEYTPATNSWTEPLIMHGFRLPIAMYQAAAMYHPSTNTLMIVSGMTDSGVGYFVYTRRVPFEANEWIRHDVRMTLSGGCYLFCG